MLRAPLCCVFTSGLISLVSTLRWTSQTPPWPLNETENTLAYPYNYINLDNKHKDDRYGKDGHKYSLSYYKLMHDKEVPPILRKDCEERREEFSKAIRIHYDPDFYNCTIEYFEHPISFRPTANYIINIQSDMFAGVRMSDRVAALDAMLKPMLLKPYRLTINARTFVSSEFHDARYSREQFKRELGAEIEEGLRNYHQAGPLEAKMKEKLTEAFDPEICVVNNEGYKYDEPDGCEHHFSVAVVSYKFVRKTVKEAKEMVKHILREELPLLKSLDILADVPVILPTLIPTPLVWYKREEMTHRPLDVECWPF